MRGSGNSATQAPINIRIYNYFNLIKLNHTYFIIIIVIHFVSIIIDRRSELQLPISVPAIPRSSPYDHLGLGENMAEECAERK